MLYKLDSLNGETEELGKPAVEGRIVVFSPFRPEWFWKAYRAGGSEYIKTVVLGAWSAIAGVARSRDIRVWAYVGNGGRLLHYSVVCPSAMHMPWLDEEETGSEIGGCLTVPSARGKRLYPYVLQRIRRENGNGSPIYMIVEANNMASRAGMERAGFKLTRVLARKSGGVRPPTYEDRTNGGRG